MENYENLGTVGEGTYGVVMKCRHKESGQIVAIKKFKESDEDEQVRKTAMREVRILKQLRHDNIINLIEMFRRKNKLYLVFEFLDSTILGKIEKYPYGIPDEEVKRYMYQLLQGIRYCHMHNIIHRDIKPENLLVSKNGVLKLCDFGFARTLEGTGSKYTDYVSTRWYRAPELLVGDREYGKPVDIWAVGCMFAEIITGIPLFPGKSDIDQLFKIINCFGLLPERQFQIFQQNPMFENVELPNPSVDELETLDKRYPGFPEQAMSLMKLCLHQDPDQRGNYDDLLNHPFFDGVDKWYNTELRVLLEKDGMTDLARLKRREKERKAKEEQSDPTRFQKYNSTKMNTGNKENEFYGNNLNSNSTSNMNAGEALPNIRVQRMVALPYLTEKREDLPLITSNYHSNPNGSTPDSFVALPTLNDFKYKPSKKKPKNKQKGHSRNKDQNHRVGTPHGSVYSSTEFYPMRSRSPNDSMNGSLFQSKNSSKHIKGKRK